MGGGNHIATHAYIMTLHMLTLSHGVMSGIMI
jgi:hypothetical protein